MGHFARVNGVGREIASGWTKVNGIEREISLGRTQIKGVGYDIPFNTILGKLPVGASVFTNLDGELREFIVVQQGLPSSMYSETCNDTWLLMKDVYADGVWPDIIDNLDSIFLPKFDAEIQNKIKQVKIPYYTGKSQDKVYSGEQGETCTIFFLSAKELGLVDTWNWIPNDGVLLSYFYNGAGDAANQRRIAYLNGKPTEWWTRSKQTRTGGDPADVNAHTVGSDGDHSTMHIKTHHVHPDGSQFWSNASSGMRPAFIMPSDTRVNHRHIIKP